MHLGQSNLDDKINTDSIWLYEYEIHKYEIDR